MSETIERIQQREAVARQIFERDMYDFVQRFAPSALSERDEFMHALFVLFRDAMTTQRHSFEFGGQTYYEAMQVFEQRSIVGLQSAMHGPEPRFHVIGGTINPSNLKREGG